MKIKQEYHISLELEFDETELKKALKAKNASLDDLMKSMGDEVSEDIKHSLRELGYGENITVEYGECKIKEQ